MIQLNGEIQGTVELEQSCTRMDQAVFELARDVAKSVRLLVHGRTPIGEKNGGTLKSSWSDVTPYATGFSFQNDTHYAGVLETGGYKGVGPRTVRREDGIYSRQAPGGMIGPVIADDAQIESIAERAVRVILGAFR